MPAEVATSPVTKEPTGEGLCIPAGPLKVSVGDSLTLAGPWQLKGEVGQSSGQIPDSAVSAETTFTVKAVEDRDWVVGDATVSVEHSSVLVTIDQVWRDAQGDAVETYEEEGFRHPIDVTNLGPVLTLDWDCHRKAWLRAPWMNVGVQGAAEVSVEGRAISVSQTSAIVFMVAQVMKEPDRGIEVSTERIVVYDKLTGWLVAIESHSTGTVNGQPFSMDTVQQLEE